MFKRLAVLLTVAVGLLLARSAPAATDAAVKKADAAVKVAAKVAAKDAVVVAASQLVSPVPAPVDAAVKQPTSAGEALDAGKDFVGAIKAKRWWFASAIGIFLLLFALGVMKLWVKIGTTWAWIAVGGLSLAAGCFAAFDTKGFNWSTLLGYLTAGPTIAWLRDFMKDVIINKKST